MYHSLKLLKDLVMCCAAVLPIQFSVLLAHIVDKLSMPAQVRGTRPDSWFELSFRSCNRDESGEMSKLKHMFSTQRTQPLHDIMSH